MPAHHPRVPPFLWSGLIVAGTALALAIAAPARADVGVQPILPGGSCISPGGETPIQMVAEKVEMTVRPATEADNAIVTLNPDAYGFRYFEWAPRWFHAVAEVKADFTMNNPSDRAVRMTVWFPLASTLESVGWELNPEEIVPRIEGLQVDLDSGPVVLSVSEWPNPKGEDRPPLPWASFPVTFPAGKETRIYVRYTVPAEGTLEGMGMQFYYVFQTGAGWAGPIGKAEFVVHLPFPASAETIGAMPQGGRLDGRDVSWIWENFEPGPDDDFSIWLMLPDRWDALQADRAAVAAAPEDGEAWLKLAGTYHRLILGKYAVLRGFGDTYRPLGVHAARQAAALLPGDGRPHYELAMFYLTALPENPSLADLKPMMDELAIVEKLAPSYAPDVHDWFEFIVHVDSWSDYWAAVTAAAPTRPSPLATPTARPVLPPTPAPGMEGGSQVQAIVGLVAAGAILLVAVVAIRRRRATVTK